MFSVLFFMYSAFWFIGSKFSKLECHAFWLQSWFCHINCKSGGLVRNSPEDTDCSISVWLRVKVKNLFSGSFSGSFCKCWVHLSCSWLDCAGGRLPLLKWEGARKMGKVSTLCGPEISFESPQITHPTNPTSTHNGSSCQFCCQTVFWAPSISP